MVDANLLWLIGLSCSATWMTWIHWTGRFPGPVDRDEQVVRTGWRSEGESSEQMSRSVWGQWGRLEEAGLTYALQRQRQVGRAAPTRGRQVQTGRALWSPSGCSGGGGGGGGRGVIFTKVRDKFPSWFSSGPERDWRGVGGVFVGSQPRVWETEIIYSKIFLRFALNWFQHNCMNSDFSKNFSRWTKLFLHSLMQLKGYILSSLNCTEVARGDDLSYQ